MTGDWTDGDDYDDAGESGGSLRKQLEAALKKAEAASERATKAEARVAEGTATQVLKEMNYKPETASWAKSQGVKLDDKDALAKWITDNEAFLVGFKSEQVATDVEGVVQEQKTVADPPPPEGALEGHSALSQLHATAQPGLMNKYEAANATLPKGATKEEVLAAYAAL